MEESAGIYRVGASLAKGAEQLRQVQERLSDIAIEDHSRTFNTERVAALELSNMLDVAETIVDSALRREESRGAHQRTDFPARRRSAVSDAFADPPQRRWLIADRVHAGHNHPLAPGRAGLRGGCIR